MREAFFRRDVARELAYAGPDFIRAGIIDIERYRRIADRAGTPALTVNQCVWQRFAGERGEIDIYLPAWKIAVECKVARRVVRANWEEALGQAMRDRTSLVVNHSYVAVPDCPPAWVHEAAGAGNIGIISICQAEMRGSLRIRFLHHPEVRP